MTIWMFDILDINDDGFYDKAEMKLALTTAKLPNSDDVINVNLYNCYFKFSEYLSNISSLIQYACGGL